MSEIPLGNGGHRARARLAATVVLGREAFRGTWGATAAFFAIVSRAGGVVAFIRADEGALSEGLLAIFIGPVIVA